MAENYFEQFGYEETPAEPAARAVPDKGPANFFSAFDGEPDASETIVEEPPAAARGPAPEPFDPVPGVSWADTVHDQMNRDNAERKRKEKEALDKKRGDSFLEGITDTQQYGEFFKGIIPGAVRFAGTTLKGTAGLQTALDIDAKARAQWQIETLDQIARGEQPKFNPNLDQELARFNRVPPDQRGEYADEMQAYRERLTSFLDRNRQITPTEDRTLYGAGKSVTDFSKTILPADPEYREAIGRQLGEGVGSLIAGLPAGFLGRMPALAFFGSAGSGEAVERAIKFDKEQRKAGKPGLTEDQIATSAIWGIAPGATDLVPIEILFGRLKVPKPFQKVFARAIGRIGGQAFIEGIQEGGQQFLQNLIAQEIYNPDQSLSEGVVSNAELGGGVGGIAQAAKETAKVLAKSFGGRKRSGGKRSGGGEEAPATDEDLTIEEIAEAIDNPQPQEVVRETKQDRLDVTEQAGTERFQRRGERPADTPSQTVIRFIRERGGIQPSGETDAMDAGRYPGLVSQRGMTPDEAREALVEANFLTETGTDETAVTTPDDVYDLLGRAIRGERVVPVAEQAADRERIATEEAYEFDRELEAAEQNFVYPALAEIDAEIGTPVLADAYRRLSNDDKAELIERYSREGEGIDAILEEMAIRNEDAPTIAAMAIRRGLNDEQIAQVRELIAQQSPELAAGFDELIASLPKPRKARQPKQRAAPALSQERQAAASDYASRLRSSIDDKSSFDAVLAAANKALKKPELEAAAREFLGYDATFRTKAEAVNALKQRQIAERFNIQQPKVQTLEQFAIEHGLTTTADVDSHIHAGLRSKPTTKTYDRFYERKLAELQDARDATVAAYNEAIASGEIRAPTELERLEATAKGHPDNAATQAAQRVLEKRRARAERAARADGRQIARDFDEAVARREQAEAGPAPRRKEAGSSLTDFARASAGTEIADRFNILQEDAASLLGRNAFTGEAQTIVERLAGKAAEGNQHVLNNDWEALGQVVGDMAADAATLTELDARPEARLITQWVDTARRLAREGGVPVAERAEADPQQLRRQFADVLNSRTPRSKWAQELGIDEAGLEPLIEEAIRKGFLRRDKNGNVRRVPKSQRSGSFAAMVIPENLPDTMPDEGDVALTPKAEAAKSELNAAIDRAAAKILPEAVSIDVRDNIEIATLRREDQMLALREEAAFRRWFGSSKVVDENGQPLVVYHGTSATIGEDFALNPDQIGSNFGFDRRGFFFTDDERLAHHYVGVSADEIAELRSRITEAQASDLPRAFRMTEAGREILSRRVVPAYLSIQKPLTKADVIKDARYKSEPTTTAVDFYDTHRELINGIADEGDFDGIIISEGGSTTYVAFEPTQVKSTANRGTFDPTDPRISYALRTGRGQTESDLSATVGEEETDADQDRAATGREGVETGEGQPAPGGTAATGEGIQGDLSGDRDARIPDRALARIIRQESASLDADGNIIAGRPSRSAKASRKGGEDVQIQRAGKVEPFDVAGFEGRVKAEKLNDRDAREGNLARLTYEVREPGRTSGIPLGEMEITQRSDGAWEVGYVEIRAPRNGIATKLYGAVEKDLGIRMSPSGILSESGHAFWQKRSPASVQWHVKTPTFSDQTGPMYFSPRKISDELDRIGSEIKRLDSGVGTAMRVPKSLRETQIKKLRKERGQLIRLYGSLPIEARARNVRDSMFALRAFHGSPYDFDRFDLSRIGTGEGAQAFGHGLYFAENEMVAGTYRDNLSAQTMTINGYPFQPRNYEITQIVGRNLGDLKKMRSELAEYVENRADNPYADIADANRIIDAIADGVFDVGTQGALYEVEIDVEPEQLLDWDLPIYEQSDTVKNTLKSLGIDIEPKGKWTVEPSKDGKKWTVRNVWGEPSGTFSSRKSAEAKALEGTRRHNTGGAQLAYTNLGGNSFYHHLDKGEASRKLRKAGIPGIRYLDQGSRDAGDGTRNIVIFDDSLVKITKKNGEPVKATERQQVVDQMFALRGFHSSPYDFDRFDMSKIGEGEGAQAFGWGLYFADSEKVAGHYAMSVPDQQLLREARDAYDEFEDPDSALELLLESETLTEPQKRFLSALAKDDWFGFDYPHQAVRAALRDDPKNWDASQETLDAIKGLSVTYEVSIKADEKDFLDWDKPVTEQPIAEKIGDIWFRGTPKAERADLVKQVFSGWTGKDLYKQVARGFGSDEAASKYLADNGVAGIRYLDQASRRKSEGTRNTVVFDDKIIEITHKDGEPVSAEERQGVVDQMFSLRGFYSPAIRAAENISQAKGTGEQFYKQITKVPGVRKDELEWMGLEEFLQGKKSITKDEVLAFMRAHQVELDERVLGDTVTAEKELTEIPAEQALSKVRWSEDWFEQADKIWSYRIGDEQYYITNSSENGWGIHSADGSVTEGKPTNLDQARHMLDGVYGDEQDDPGLTKFADYKVPGGENYRELLIRLPELGQRDLTPDEQARLDALNAESRQLFEAPINETAEQKAERHNRIGEISKEAREISSLTDPRFTSPHFQDQEIVHLRVDDRTGPNGEKVLFVNEVQSDLLQTARRFGFGKEGFQKARRVLNWQAFGDKQPTEKALIAARKYNGMFGSEGAPKVPFTNDTAVEIALKRALLYASESGYDAVSWARSDQAAKAVGADQADLALQYDKNMGKFLDKYTRKWGGKVEEVGTLSPEYEATAVGVGPRTGQFKVIREVLGRGELSDRNVDGRYFDSLQKAEAFATQKNGENPLLRITPEMRSSVMEGQPLALRGGQPAPQILTPEFRNWFKDSKVVDEGGKPLRVYHATGADIEVFQPGADGGIHFGTTEQANMRSPARGNVVPVYLRAEKLKRTKDSEGNWKKTIARAKREGNDGIVYLNRYEGIPREEFQAAFDKGITQEQMDSMPDARFRKMFPSARDSYIVFEPNQIKSAIGNRGTFDPTDPSIINAMRRQDQPEALGQTDPYNMLISIGMNAVEAEAKAKGVTTTQEAIRVLRHEAVEFFKAMGMFTEKEWNTLKTAAKRNGWVETTGVRQAYEAVYKGGMSETEMNDLLIKEAIAEQYSEFHLNRKQFSGKIAEVFQRIKDFIDRIANFMRGEGFQTWDDVFQSIDQGEFKARFEEAFPELAPEPAMGVRAMQATAGKIPDSTARRATPGTAQPEQSLAEIISNFSRTLGITVRQGRLDPDAKRLAAAQGKELRGQTSLETGVVRLRVPNEIDTLAHEGGHALENRFGGALDAIKQQFAAELTGSAMPTTVELSEGFAEWFRRYVTNPKAAQRVAPGFQYAFEAFLKREDAPMLARLGRIQTGYQNWILAPSGGAVASAIVTTAPPGSLKAVTREFKEEGLAKTMQSWTDRIYTTVFDDLNPIRMTVDHLLDIAAKNLKVSRDTLGLTTVNDAYKLLRMARDGFAAGLMDLLYGVHDYQSVNPQGPSLRDAIATAFGGFDKSQWSDESVKEFGAYLGSRRMVKEWLRFQRGELALPPDKFSLADHQQAVRDFEKKYPGFAAGAQQVYTFLNNMLRKKRDAGLISSAVYDELILNEDYVPVMRDRSDQARGGVEGPRAQRQDKYSVIRRFRGSQRDIINPLESIAKDAYETAMIIARNDAIKALDALARAAGPDGGKFAERIPAHEMTATQVNIQDALRLAANDAGVSPADLQIMLTAVDDQLGDNAVAQIWRAGDISERGEAIVYLWENGDRIPIRLADGQFGHDMLHAVAGLNREAGHWLVNVMSLPSTVLRTGVTASLDFIGANFIRDQVSAWILTKDFVPFYDGARGIYNDLRMRDVSRIYSRVGGIMGGSNVAAQHESRIKREVQGLRRKGIRFTLNPFTRDFWRMTEFSESGTRLAVFERAFARAKKDGLSDWEAAVEGGFMARDYIDFGRRGSRMLAVRRLVPFFNAALQGLDRGIRGLRGRVDDHRPLRDALSPYIKSRTGQPLSRIERRNKRLSAQVWAYTALLGVIGFALSVLYRDDEEYEEISDYMKATHWLFRVDGEWVRVPKPFELAFVSNLMERTFDYVYKDDPTAFDRFWSGFYEITVPPHSVPLLTVSAELATDYNFFTGRPIVGPFLKQLPPELQFNAYASEFGKYLGKQVGISPAYIDHFITGYGASWGREFINASDQGLPALGRAADGLFGLPTRPSADPAVQDYFFLRRFTTDPARGSTSVQEFWKLMAMENGEFEQAASGYKHLIDKVRDVKGAQDFLDRLTDEERAYALLLAGNSHRRSKYRRLHPLERAKEIVTVAGGLKKEINLNRLYKGRDGDPIELSPSQMRTVTDLLSDITMRETRNSLIALKRRGWAQKKLLDVDTVYGELEAVASEVHKELTGRLKAKKLPSFETVAKAWPVARDRILADGQEAILMDLYQRDYSIGEGAAAQ